MRYALVALISLFLLPLTPAQAHFLATDNNIGAILHIDPDDDPIANQNATFFFDIKDKDNKFQISDCTCQVHVSENGTDLYSSALSQATATSPSFSFVFPKQDVYHITLSGTPETGNAFQPFTIQWDIRVDRTGTSTTSPLKSVTNYLSIHFIHFLLILIAAGIVLYTVYKEKHSRTK